MNDEIKNILDMLKDSVDNPILQDVDQFAEETYEYPNYFTLDPNTKDCKLLLDYITNLQEELKSIKSNYKIQLEYDEELEDYKSRNEKAIEIIKTYSNMLDTRGVLLYSNLLNVLQGSDKE